MSWGVTDLVVRRGAVAALHGVSLEIPSGRVVGVVGADGAGKSTLLGVLAGALGPTSGQVRRPSPFRIGYLPAGSGTYPDLTVEESIDFAAAAYQVSRREARLRSTDFLERTRLAPARHRLAWNLSGGMRQKLGLICAMLHRPDLLVLDEPTTGVDPASRADLWWLVARAAAADAAVVLATTYLDEAERTSWVLVLDGGRTLAEGTPDAISSGVTGTLGRTPFKPAGEAARRAWRRGDGWRVWAPAGTEESTAGLEVVLPDLQDAVTLAALRRELERGGT